jgi:hypothetical protein
VLKNRHLKIELIVKCCWSTFNKQCVIKLDDLFRSSLLTDERLVNVRNDTTTSNCGFDQTVKFFVSTNSKLKMARSDTFDFQIFRCISSQFENLRRIMKLLDLTVKQMESFERYIKK